MQNAESRRNYVRITVPPRIEIPVRFADGRVYPALDLSVYGIAFACEISDMARFSMAQSWPDVEFALEGRPVRVRAKVVHLQSDAVPGKLKVGVEFSEIAAEDVFALSEFITRHAHLAKPTMVRIVLGRRRPVLKKKSRKKKPAKKPAKKAAKKAAKKPLKKPAKRTPKRDLKKKLRR